MGSLSIWHWIVVLILFSPIILGVMILGWQQRILIKHADSNLIKSGYVGWSWSYSIFGFMVPIVRGEIGVGVLHLILTMITFGFFQFVMSFLYNKHFMTRQLTNGWQLHDTEEKMEIGKRRLNISSN